VWGKTWANQKNLGGKFSEGSGLFKAVRLFEENGFYVVYADFGLGGGGRAGELAIRAYPKRTVSVEIRPDVIMQA
jgi:hypothetical protein